MKSALIRSQGINAGNVACIFPWHILRAGEDDIELWEKMGRSDILEMAAYLPLGENVFVYDIDN